jgi:hypothetical protein
MVVAFFVGLGLGLALLYGYNRSQRRRIRRVPTQWPLQLRPLVNHREKQVWLWLTKVMFDQQILVKLPVTRFTAPTRHADAAQWYQLLNGVYCSFTVCDLDGRVIGCIDVPGPRGLSMSNQTLKHKLLAHCKIHYLVVDPLNLPHLLQIRTALLGDTAARGINNSGLESQFKDVKQTLHAIVDRKRQNKGSARAQPEAITSNPLEDNEGQLAPGWEQNSFVMPLDSRVAPLGR